MGLLLFRGAHAAPGAAELGAGLLRVGPCLIGTLVAGGWVAGRLRQQA